MGSFSSTRDADAGVCDCQQGNLFLADFPAETGMSSRLSFSINGLTTGPLPSSEVYRLPNTLDGTVQALEAHVNGRSYPIVENLERFSRTQPEEVGVAIGGLPANPQPSARSASTVEEILVLQVPTALIASAPPPGDIDPDTASEGKLLWIAQVVVTTLEAGDNILGLDDLFVWSQGYVDLQLTGTDSTPFLAEFANLISQRNIRSGVATMLKGAAGVFRVMVNSAGALVLAFRQSAQLAAFVAGAAASIARSKVSTIMAGVRGALSHSATAARGMPVIGFVIVGVVDFFEWYADPESRGDWANLISVLTVDAAALTISTIAGGLAATLAVGLLAGAAATLGGVLAVAAVGIGVGLVVGMAVTAVFNAFELQQKVESALNWLGRGAVSAVSGLEAAIDAAYEFLTHAQPRDGRITGPTDYLMEVDRGISDYIYQRLGLPRF